MKILYLCGAINGCTDAEAKDWRETAKARLVSKYRILDPMRRDYRGREDDNVGLIVRSDLTDIDCADVVLVAGSRASWGTAMETFYAFGAGKVVVTVCESERVSPWLRHHSTKLVRSMSDALGYLETIA